MSRLPAVALALLTAVLSTVLHAALPAGAAGAEQVQLQVAPSVLTYDTTVGTRLDLSVTVTNTTSSPVTAHVGAVSATTANNGGLGYSATREPGPARWLHLDQDTIELAVGASGEITGRIDVPSDAPNGDSIAAVAVWVPVEEAAGSTGASDVGAEVKFQVRQVVPVVISTPGGSPADLNASALAVAAGAEPRLDLVLENRGDARSSGTGDISIPALGITAPFSSGTVLPRESTSLTVPWTGDLPEGEHTAHVTVTDATGRTTTWSGELSTSSDVADPSGPDTSDHVAQQPAPAPSGSGPSSPLLMGLAVIVGGAAVAGTQRISRTRQRSVAIDPVVLAAADRRAASSTRPG